MIGKRPWHRIYRPGTPIHIDYPEAPVAHLLDESAARYPDLPALAFEARQVRYGELAERVNRMANALIRLGLRKGDRIALMLPNSPAYVISYFGALKAGGMVAQVNPLYTEREVQRLLNDCAARFLVVSEGALARARGAAARTSLHAILLADLAAEPRARSGGEDARGADVTGVANERPPVAAGTPVIDLCEALAAAPATEPGVAIDPHEDVAVLQYTGGTTGTPKGAMLTHFNLVANVYQGAAWSDPPRPGEERILVALPLFHAYAMTGCMLRGLHRGALLVLLPRFEPGAAVAAIRAHRVTSFPAVPTMYVALLNHPDADPSTLREIRQFGSGGAPMPVEVLEAFEEKFGTFISEGYGLSETSPTTHRNPPWERTLRKKGSVGIPVPDTDCKIGDPETGQELPPGHTGEIALSGPQIMKGYWNRPEETAAVLRDGWFYTGDVGHMDEDGYLYVTDRKKEMILVSGFNVYPREIEEALYEHPAVAEAAVIGVADAYQGETPKAFVALKPGQRVMAEEIVAFCKERLAPYKVPKWVEFRDSLPKSAVGKILRRELR